MKKISFSNQLITSALDITALSSVNRGCTRQTEYPNIVIIYADDPGYGDISCNGATSLNIPNTDRVADKGLLFTNAHSTSVISTTSRYSVLMDEYVWRGKEPASQQVIRQQ